MDHSTLDKLFLELTFAATGESEEPLILEKVLPMYLQKLNCTMVAVLQHDGKTELSHTVLPKAFVKSAWEELCLRIFEGQAMAPAEERLLNIQLEDQHYYAYCLPHYGWLLIGRSMPFERYLLNELKSVVLHLSKALNLALESKRREAQNEALQLYIGQLSMRDRVLEGVSDAIQVSDEEGNLIYLNLEATKRLGIRSADVPKYAVGDFEPLFKDKEAWKKHVQELKEVGSLVVTSTNINQETGLRFPVEVTVSGVSIGNDFRVIAISRDITARLAKESELKSISDTLSSMFDALPDLILKINQSLTFTYCHSKDERQLYLEPERFIGKNAIEVLPQYLVVWLEEAMKESLKVGGTKLIEYKLEVGGEMSWFEARINAINELEYLCVIRNITDRKTAELELLRKEEMLKAVADASNYLLTEADLFSAIGKSLQRLGEAADVDRTYLFVGREEDGALVLDQELEWIREGVVAQIDNPELKGVPVMPEFEETVVHFQPFQKLVKEMDADSFLRGLLEMQDIVSIIIIPIVVDRKFWGFVGFDDCSVERQWSEAEVSMLVGFSAGIAGSVERKKTEVKLAEMARFPEENPSPIIRLNKAGERLLQNSAARRIKQVFYNNQWLSDEAFYRQISAQAKASDQLFTTEFASGDAIYYLEARRSEADGTIHLYTTDVTELKSIEAELIKAKEVADEASAAKSTFLANMSHEIRTPLNSIIGFIELLETTPLTVLQVRYLQSVKTSGKVLLDTINDILDISKIEANKFELLQEEFSLWDLLGNLSQVSSQKAREKNLELVFNVDPEIQPLREGDSIRIQQVLINLIGNAIKFTQEGSVVLGIDALPEENTLRFSVADTGIGIRESHKSLIMEAFAQEDVSVTRKFGGTGLGLTISGKILQLMNSELKVESTHGEGSKFWFDLHLSEAAKPLHPTDFEKSLETTILVRNSLQGEALKRLCEQCTRGSQRLENLGEFERVLQDSKGFDLVVVDVELLTGLEALLQKVQSNNPEFHPPKIVVAASDVEEVPGTPDRLVLPLPAIPTTVRKLMDELSATKTTMPPSESALASALGQKALTILAVDDSQMNLFLAESLVSTLLPNSTCLLAASGREAEEIAQNQAIDLVLMDVQMPEMSGYEATQVLRKMEHLKTVPIIALTAGIVVGERERCLEAGMDDYISKPIDMVQFRSALQQWLQLDEI